jgi:hypothetical protein
MLRRRTLGGSVPERYPIPKSSPPPARSQPPASVRAAVKLMFVGAGLEVVALLVAVTTVSTLKSALLKANRNYTAAQLHNVAAARTTALVLGALITIALWLWMAWANDRGRRWARIVAAVLFTINTLDLLLSIDVVHAIGTVIIGAVIWVVGLAAIVLLFRKESAPFYRQGSA